MSTLSYDGQSLSVDSRRIWLVSGAIHYARTPHQLWRRRIRAAKEAGLNCIQTCIFWNFHERSPGKFDFEGDRDVRRFVQIVGEEGMYCMLRPGPYVCAEWDFGGLPAWLHRLEPDRKVGPLKLRQSHPQFLEATSRYLTAVMEQVRDLQVTTPVERGTPRMDHGHEPGKAAGGYTGGGRGPIILMQAEHEWLCHNPEQAETYLREIVRYLRENGCEVPIHNCNNLWQRVDGTIDTWNGTRNLVTDLRQLAVVQPETPRLVSEYRPGGFDQWGRPHATVDSQLHLYRMAGILGAGAMFNLHMFHGGTNFAFHGGRTVASPDSYVTTSYDCDAPLLEAGGRGEKFGLTKRISTFASHFGHLFAHLNTSPPPATPAPDENDHNLTVLHQWGSQGEVIFLLRGPNDKSEQADVLLPNGLTLPVPLGTDRVAWVVLNANLQGAAMLNYTNLRPWAFADKRMLVLFGPAGAAGLASIDDVPLEVTVPEKDTFKPHVDQHEKLTLVVLNTEQVDRAYLFEGGLAVNSAGLNDAGRPQPRSGSDPMYLVSLNGEVHRNESKPQRKPPAPKLSNWQYASLCRVIDGTDEGFKQIDGPAALSQLQADAGYGWYKIGVGKGKSGQMFAPEAGDRLHIYNDNKLQSILGGAPGAESQPKKLTLSDDVIILADNLGRYNFSQAVGEKKGLFGHVVTVREAKLGKPKIVSERAADPFALSGFVMHRRKGERPIGDALVWSVKPESRNKPVILDIRGLELQGTWLVNGQPLAVYLGGDSGGHARYVLTPGTQGFTGGHNEIKFSLFGPYAGKVDLDDRIRLYHVTEVVTNRGNWYFKPWTRPEGKTFEKLPRSLPSQPAWYRGEFTSHHHDLPLWLEPRGMSKGQIYLNGHNVGRYFVATAEGKKVGPQEKYYLPEPWLHSDGPNEIMLFDEHGRSPSKCRLVYEAMGPYGK